MSNTPVDGVAAARTMLGFGTWRQGYCLEAVWNAYNRNGAQDINGKADPTAYQAWLNTSASQRVTGVGYDKIPAGVPVWFGPKSSSSAGDVVISDGGGWCIATDIPGAPGQIGRIRLSDRQRQISRPYLGYTTTILGWPIKQAVTPEPEPDTTEEEPMFGRFTYERDDGDTVRVVHGEAYFEEHSSSAIKNADINQSLNLPKDAPWPSMPQAYRDVVFNACLAVRMSTQGNHHVPS